MKSFLALGLGAMVLGISVGPLVGRTPAAPGLLTRNSLLDIKHPSSPIWSPDGSRLAFVWDRAGAQNIWVIAMNGDRPEPPRNVTRLDAELIHDFFWSRNGEQVYFPREGDLWQVPGDGSSPPRPAWTTSDAESGMALAPDGERVAFSRGGDLWVRSLRDDREFRVTTTPMSESGPVWSPDGSRLAFSITSSARRSHTPQFHGAKIQFTWSERTALPDVGIVSIANGRIVPAAASADAESGPAWIDNVRLSVQRIAQSYRAREILAVDAVSGAGRVLHRDQEDRWFNLTYNGAQPVPSPDGRWLAFLTDRDGWDHLYLVSTSDGRVTQLTRGKYEVSRLAWSPDGKRIAFDASELDAPGTKQVVIVDVKSDGSPGRTTQVTSGRGANVEPVWSPRGDRLAYQHTDARNSADLFVVRSDATSASGRSVRLTDSIPATIDRSKLIEPRLIRYPAPDGQQVPANLFVPPGLDKSRKHPAIVWIHGDLVTQNYDGWHIRRDYGIYYSFHQYLLQRGYIVLAPDYRGSTGYGKDWRLGVYRDLGGKDYQDVAAGVAFLSTLGFVDMDRIGVWGLSYGGFLTLQALTVTPELFRCGVNVSGVVDWEDYLRDPGQPWLIARMGSRADNPAQYEQGAPVRRVDRIVRPIMVLASTADVNVPYEQSVRLVDALLKAGKDVEFMMYPGEFHYFHRAHVVSDAWRRVERFFDTHLRARSSPSDQ